MAENSRCESKTFGDLIEQYALKCVTDMDLDLIERCVAQESIEQRLRDSPPSDIINEILESAYSEELRVVFPLLLPYHLH